jgi:hypothetical protein
MAAISLAGIVEATARGKHHPKTEKPPPSATGKTERAEHNWHCEELERVWFSQRTAQSGTIVRIPYNKVKRVAANAEI